MKKTIYTDRMALEISNARIVARIGLSFTIMGVLLFGAAGTLLWPEAWLYIMLHLGYAFFMTAWMKLHDPELLKKRTELSTPASGSWDSHFFWLLIVLFVLYLIIPGLDAVRYGWSTVQLMAKVPALVLLTWSLWLVFRVMQENSFASPMIEVQKERGHRVIDSGPYAFVRHPMYAGVIAYLFALPIWLGSLWTLPLAAVISAMLVFRIFAEEKTLHAELDGYTAYTRRVRYRLIPKIW
jgi:protein-S-isoprenylcysteine O-methyltransferase Ste14